MKKTLLTALFTLAACASQPLSQQEKAVRILKRSDAPASCVEIAKVTAPGLDLTKSLVNNKRLKQILDYTDESLILRSYQI
ncbi:MAG: hypothetical protein IPM57_03915 [Oligoflexia bacterium]|nr:hypothetical protein [Oligoflexia bacterium]